MLCCTSEEGEAEGEGERDPSELVTQEILDFIAGLREREFLSAEHAGLLRQLLASNR